MKRRLMGIFTVASLFVATAFSVLSYAVPTNYYGHRISTNNGYYSFTYSNGYEQGSSVTNTVMAQMSGSASSRRQVTGYGAISVSSGISTGNALHGVGTGSMIQVSWTQN